MSDPIWFRLDLNPEPWAIGTVSRFKGRTSISPNPNLVAFQNAVKEALEDSDPLPVTYLKLTFYLFRQQARYLDMSDRVRQRNQADATNMQKALEDALQGILIKNDRDVMDIRSVIVQQGTAVEPRILIKAEETKASERLSEIPGYLMKERIRFGHKESDRWADAGEEF